MGKHYRHLGLEERCTIAQLAAVVDHQLLEGQVELADQQAVGKLVDHVAQSGDDVVGFRPIGRMEWQDRGIRRVAVTVGGIGRVVVKRVVLDQMAMASARKPSTPRFSQKRTTSYMASRIPRLRQLRSGCEVRKV
jgi:hypothetical protein